MDLNNQNRNLPNAYIESEKEVHIAALLSSRYSRSSHFSKLIPWKIHATAFVCFFFFYNLVPFCTKERIYRPRTVYCPQDVASRKEYFSQTIYTEKWSVRTKSSQKYSKYTSIILLIPARPFHMSVIDAFERRAHSSSYE